MVRLARLPDRRLRPRQPRGAQFYASSLRELTDRRALIQRSKSSARITSTTAPRPAPISKEATLESDVGAATSGGGAAFTTTAGGVAGKGDVITSSAEMVAARPRPVLPGGRNGEPAAGAVSEVNSSWVAASRL